jgi:hypothetical protein
MKKMENLLSFLKEKEDPIYDEFLSKMPPIHYS